MRIAKTQLQTVRRQTRHLVFAGGLVLIAAMVGGCDPVNGNGASWLAADIGEQIVVFVQDFARQALAAWLF
jgi:hypothetical protein